MTALRILNTSDLHYSLKYLDEVDRCFGHVIDIAIRENCNCAVIAGDLFDHRLDLHSPAVTAILSQLLRLSRYMPTLILAGTFSHDPPGTLEVFRSLGRGHPFHVADHIEQVALMRYDGGEYEWRVSDDAFLELDNLYQLQGTICGVFSCLPPINKASLAAACNLENAGSVAGLLIEDLMKAWSVSHLKCREYEIPSVIVSHGTVSGATTEHGVVMHGLDHEFVTETLFAGEASAVMLGHIHQMQTWRKDARMIAYPGSPGRLHFGEVTDKGFLIWNIDPDSATCEFHKTPAKTLLQIDFEGPPDLDRLAQAAAGIDRNTPAHVRVRYQIDEEYRACVDRAGIEKMFLDAGAQHVKVEGRVLPIQRSRSAGMNKLTSLADRLTLWCEVTNTETAPILSRFRALESCTESNQIIQGLLD